MMRHLLMAALLLGASPAPGRADEGDSNRPITLTPWSSQVPRCTERQAERIRPGMTVAEVTALLRCRPGDYTGGKGVYVAFIDPFPAASIRREHAVCWCGRDGAIGLVLDGQGRVGRADWYPALDPEKAR